MGVDAPEINWQQALLSPSFGGLGLHSLLCCFYPSMAFSGQGSPDDIHMLQAITHFNNQVPLHELIMVEAVLASPPLQKYLSKRLGSQFFQSLLSSSFHASE